MLLNFSAFPSQLSWALTISAVFPDFAWKRLVNQVPNFPLFPTVVLWAVGLLPVMFNFSSKNCLPFSFCFAPFKQSALFCSNPENHLLQVNNETFVCPAVHQIQEAMWNVHHESWNAKNWKFPQIFADYFTPHSSLPALFTVKRQVKKSGV